MSTAAPSMKLMSPADTARFDQTSAALSKLQAYMKDGEKSQAIRSWWGKNREQPDNQALRALLYGSCIVTAIGTTYLTGSVSSGAMTGGVGPAVYETLRWVDRTLKQRGVWNYTDFATLENTAKEILAESSKFQADSAYGSEAERNAAWDDINKELETTIIEIEKALGIKQD